MRTVIIILTCWLIEAPALRAQDLAATVQRADSLLRMRDTASVALYERALFFAHAEQKRGIRLALCRAYYTFGDWWQLERLLWNADLELDSTGREMMVFDLRLKMGQGDHEQAMQYARTYASLAPGEGRRFLFYGMMAALEAEDFARMRDFAAELLDPRGVQELDGRIRRYERKLKRPGRARLLSIVPGMGQLYAGDAGGAGKSLLLNGAVGYLVYAMWDRSRPVAIYLAIGLVPRYYFGGIRNAGRSAEFRNNALKNELREGTLNLVEARLSVEN